MSLSMQINYVSQINSFYIYNATSHYDEMTISKSEMNIILTSWKNVHIPNVRFVRSYEMHKVFTSGRSMRRHSYKKNIFGAINIWISSTNPEEINWENISAPPSTITDVITSPVIVLRILRTSLNDPEIWWTEIWLLLQLVNSSEVSLTVVKSIVSWA